MSNQTSSDRREAGGLDKRLSAYLAALGGGATVLSSSVDAAVVGNSATQLFGVNGVVSIDFNADGQTDFQIDHDRYNLNGTDLDYLQIDKNDINSETNPLAFDPSPGMTLTSTPFADGSSPRNDANESAYVIAGPQGSYPAALTQGTLIGSGSSFDFQEGDNVFGTGDWIRANRLIDEDATQIDQVHGGRPADGVYLPTNGPNFTGLGGEVRYLGLKMDLNGTAVNSGDPFSYGWVGIRIDNEAEATGAVVGYGYETVPGAGILAGDTGPFTANADFNDDGEVDGADFLIWQRQVNTSVTAGTGGDGTGDGQVTQADLDLWKGEYGSATAASIGAAAPVPEPSSLLMSGLAGAMLLVFCIVSRKIRRTAAHCR